MTRRMIFGIVIACLASAPRAATGDNVFPVFHGEKTPLQEMLMRLRKSRLVDGHVWTYSNLMVLVQLYPGPMDFRAEDVPFRGQVPWRPAWECGWFVKNQVSKSQQEVFAKSRVTMVLAEEDGTTCVVNELTGERIFREKAGQQDGSAVELPCEKMWSRFETLAYLPEDAKAEISLLLKRPLAARRFKRKSEAAVPQPRAAEH